MSETNNKPLRLVAQEEQEKISRTLIIWLNGCPEIPLEVSAIRYEELQDDTVGMTLSTIQGAAITQKYILGGYQAEYQFKLIYRVKPGVSQDKRLKADETLDRVAAWAHENQKTLQLGGNIRVLTVEPTTRSSLYAIYENGDEDHQILMNLTYEVI